MQRLGNVLIQVMKDLSTLSTNGTAEIGVNTNLCSPEEFDSLFNHFTRGTILERLNLNIQELETRAVCGCGYQENVNRDHAGYIKCPNCGKFAEVRDNPYEIISPDPSQAGARRSIRF